MKCFENPHQVSRLSSISSCQIMMFALVPSSYQTSEAVGCSKVVFSQHLKKQKLDISHAGIHSRHGRGEVSVFVLQR